jgi:AraC-like DNA-binding protein
MRNNQTEKISQQLDKLMFYPGCEKTLRELEAIKQKELDKDKVMPDHMIKGVVSIDSHDGKWSGNHLTEPHDPCFLTEDAFVMKVRSIMEKNLDNDMYNINDLCSELAVSHAQLYRKFKSNSNIGIFKYFKILRLNKARELLTTSNLNVTQVAFESGFKNLSHFSREFSLKFGKTPKKMQKANMANLVQTKQY